MTGDAPLVLVVDDDPSVRAALVRLLHAEGLAARAFASPAEFLGTPLPEVPTCLVLDLQMPGLSGLDLQAAVAARAVPPPVVFVSGHGDIPTSVRAMKAGAVDFLPKPFDEGALLQSVRQAIRQHEASLRAHSEAAGARERLARLSRREREVLDGVAAGRLNKQIAVDLGIAEKTVKVHRGHMMDKLGAGSVADLVRLLALAEG